MAWQLDKQHSEIGFAVRHMMIATVKGKFKGFDISAQIDPKDLAHSSVTATIEAGSIDTGETDRDGHLKSGDFLDVENHPHITFKSSSITKKDDEHYQVTGPLTIHGVSRDVTLEVEVAGPAKDPWGKERMGFMVRGDIDREQWGLKWNQALEAGGVLVGKKVHLNADVELVGG